MRLIEIDPNAKAYSTQYSFSEKPTAPKPPKALVKPKVKMIKPLPPDKAMVASLQQKIKSMRDRLKAVRQAQKRS